MSAESKPTFTLQAEIVARITYKEWTLSVNADTSDRAYMQWSFIARDAKTGAYAEQRSRKWYLSAHMTESEIVSTALKAALTAEEHECREHFLYAGRRVFNPHISVRALMDVCDQEDNRA